VDGYLAYFRQWLTAHLLLALLPLKMFVYWMFARRSAPCLTPLLRCASAFLPLLLCASFQFIVYCSGFFLWVSLPRGLCWFIPGVADRNSVWCSVLTSLVCWMSPKQVWSWQLAVAVAHLFSQCNMWWRSFLWSRGSVCQSFDSPWCFIFAKCGSSVSAKFLIHRAHIASVPSSPSWIP
jgi:hypothetical protein